AQRGYHRLHLLCGESLCCQIATWLRIGTTAIVVAMIDAGVKPGTLVELRDPLRALRAFVSDPACQATTRLMVGGQATAIDIQRHYLTIAEKHLDSAWMPEWAGEVCREWRAMLDRIEHAPETLSASLDWAIKLAVYRDHVEQRGFRWEDLGAWTRIAKRIRAAIRRSSYEGSATVELVLGQTSEPSPIQDTIDKLSPYLERKGFRWNMLRPFVDLRKELFEIDMRFGQLGGNGLFGYIDRAGVLDHLAPGVDRVDEAMAHPPDVARPRLRGRRIKQYAGRQGYRGYWDGIYDAAGNRRLKMSDPFASQCKWAKMPTRESRRHDMFEMIHGRRPRDEE
ncbi:MAG: proteasome accessory factor PafA2 family protein, partial [Candidatus Krumholzibacteria bacterium]|nr:proteasome accessory factor PafA2 family protein [Candidatus Krumholzibacteria bacterium]